MASSSESLGFSARSRALICATSEGPPSLRCVARAGGRLPPGVVRSWSMYAGTLGFAGGLLPPAATGLALTGYMRAKPSRFESRSDFITGLCASVRLWVFW